MIMIIMMMMMKNITQNYTLPENPILQEIERDILHETILLSFVLILLLLGCIGSCLHTYRQLPCGKRRSR